MLTKSLFEIKLLFKKANDIRKKLLVGASEKQTRRSHYAEHLSAEALKQLKRFLSTFNDLRIELTKDFASPEQIKKTCIHLTKFYQDYIANIDDAFTLLKEFSQLINILKSIDHGVPAYVPLSDLEIQKLKLNLLQCSFYGPRYLAQNLTSYEQIDLIRNFLNYFLNDQSQDWHYLDNEIAKQLKMEDLSELDLIACTGFELIAIFETCEKVHIINRFKALSFENKNNFLYLHEAILKLYDAQPPMLIFTKAPTRSLYTEFLEIIHNEIQTEQLIAHLQSPTTKQYPGQNTLPIENGTQKASLASIKKCIRLDHFINHMNSFLDIKLQTHYFTFKKAVSLLEKIKEKNISKQELKGLIQRLVVLYKEERQEGYINPKNKHEYRHNRCLSKLFGGYSKTEKIDAATAFENLLSKNEPIPADKLGPLNQGDLGKIFRFYQDNIMEVNAQKVLLQSLWL